MTSYNTGNPIGSKDPRDLYDNAENLDTAVNTHTAESWDDRFGVPRKTWWGMEQDFQQFLLDSGYVNIGDYGPGLEITARNQIFWRDGELYRAGAALELPYTTTGDWGEEESLFVAVGDAALRQELANPDKGAAMVARGVLAVESIDDLLSLPVEQRKADLRYLVRGYYSGSTGGGGEFYYDESSIEASDGGSVIGEGTGRFKRLITNFVTPEMFGAIGDAVNDDTIYLQYAINFSVRNKLPILCANKYCVGSLDVSAIEGDVYFRLSGELIRLPSESEEAFFAIGSKETVVIDGGGVIDLNCDNQQKWNDGVTIDAVNFANVNNITFKNAKSSAIYFRSAEARIKVEHCTFIEGSLHTGVLNEGSCVFLTTRGGKDVHISNNRFIHTKDPLTNENRNPAGYVNIDTGAPQKRADGSVFVIENNYFENLGHHAAGNLLSPLDFYSYIGTIHITGNVFRKSRVTPIRTSAGHVVVIDGNNIQQREDQIIDGGAPYMDAAMISLSLVDRGYPSDDNDIAIAVIQNNRMRSFGAVACHGISAGSGSPDYLYRRLSVLDNQIRSFPASIRQGVFINCVRESKISGNSIEGFAQAVRIQETNKAPLIAGGMALCNISENRFAGNGNHVWARTAVGNLHMTVRDNVGVSATSFPFTLRNMSSAIIQGCSFTVSGGGDVNNVGALWIKDNDIGSAQPAGLSTCPYYRVTDNKGMTNASSA